VDSIEKLKGKLNQLRSELTNLDTVRDIYRWCFMFAKEPEQKTLGKSKRAILSEGSSGCVSLKN